MVNIFYSLYLLHFKMSGFYYWSGCIIGGFPYSDNFSTNVALSLETSSSAYRGTPLPKQVVFK